MFAVAAHKGPGLLRSLKSRFDALLPAPKLFCVRPIPRSGTRPVRTLDGGMHAPTVREWLNSGMLTGACSIVLSTAESTTDISVVRIVPVTIRAPQVVWIIGPRRTTQQPLLRARTDARFVVAPAKANGQPLCSPAPLWGADASTILASCEAELIIRLLSGKLATLNFLVAITPHKGAGLRLGLGY